MKYSSYLFVVAVLLSGSAIAQDPAPANTGENEPAPVNTNEGEMSGGSGEDEDDTP